MISLFARPLHLVRGKEVRPGSVRILSPSPTTEYLVLNIYTADIFLCREE